MIQSTLFFILGFLCAGFLALMVAPAIWRRAVALTRKRIEASMPLTLNEMQAETDRVRAEAAMSIRRLEISVKALKEKAANQMIELNRSREELKRLTDEAGGKSNLLAGLEARMPDMQTRLREREEQVASLSKRLTEADELIEKQASELRKLGRTYEEATFLSSSRQIEIAGRESEIERISSDMSRLRSQHKDMERRLEELTTESQALEENLKSERKRSADLEKKIEQMLSKLTGLETTLEKRERELSRLRQAREGVAGNENDPASKPGERAKARSGNGQADGELAQLSAERDRLESRLTTLTRENKRLRAKTAEGGNGEGAPDGDASLREQIHQLAAEVVNLTAQLDGADSPIRKALSMPSTHGPEGSAPAGKIASLADRIRALQKAAAGD